MTIVDGNLDIPAGIAVAGSNGIQIFHFNGADPPTSDTAALTTDPITQMFWDRFGHLYAISPTAGKLHVFNVNAVLAQEALGSPYPINADRTSVNLSGYVSMAVAAIRKSFTPAAIRADRSLCEGAPSRMANT